MDGVQAFVRGRKPPVNGPVGATGGRRSCAANPSRSGILRRRWTPG